MTRLVPSGADVRSVAVSAGVLRVLHAGAPSSLAPLVLIHGGGTDNAAISWYRLMEPLSEDREVWAIDLPGFGASVSVPPVGGPGALAGVVAEAMAALGIPRAVVFGVSMGGDVAITLALKHPALVSGLVLIAPGGLTPILRNPTAQFWAWVAAQAPDWMLVPAARFANRFVRSALRALVTDPSTLPPEAVEEFVREARDPRGGVGYARYNQATLGRRGMLNDHTGQMSSITVPTLFFNGADDRLVDPDDSRRAAALMQDARLVVVPHCGHWAQLEAHDRFLAEVREFLGDMA
ncbi:pimeloyl-ACP methyl ester carboxylesterase [Microbacteriaceae bacterium SG_E_30_P1]|uniref:Pimeloyl-ACP methyl ester carboxylesterase n=1 Tax=Antiquaquibacter oligotrophicus TaxID=2880260 RepID=A0ABT6KNT1_9MICO|nr:alpha/beta fold hydrolase [Antiquaquibacter oligotrophicus]MDH6181420.1 pimeloyl-ACP methyl ester carboxylesterase [Antiquaquibacter oligotrophicus]UDF12888.1 alpha/beta fold hydrolase [Antiquaquibacter oligotrophicus]